MRQEALEPGHLHHFLSAQPIKISGMITVEINDGFTDFAVVRVKVFQEHFPPPAEASLRRGPQNRPHQPQVRSKCGHAQRYQPDAPFPCHQKPVDATNTGRHHRAPIGSHRLAATSRFHPPVLASAGCNPAQLRDDLDSRCIGRSDHPATDIGWR
ncbi:hypothetical protein D3C80_1375520 [compost metagenome]